MSTSLAQPPSAITARDARAASVRIEAPPPRRDSNAMKAFYVVGSISHQPPQPTRRRQRRSATAAAATAASRRARAPAPRRALGRGGARPRRAAHPRGGGAASRRGTQRRQGGGCPAIEREAREGAVQEFAISAPRCSRSSSSSSWTRLRARTRARRPRCPAPVSVELGRAEVASTAGPRVANVGKVAPNE